MRMYLQYVPAAFLLIGIAYRNAHPLSVDADNEMLEEARLALQQNDVTTARARLFNALKADVPMARVHGVLSEQLRRIQREQPLFPTLNLTLAAAYLSHTMGKHKTALQYYLQADRFSHSDWQIPYRIGELLSTERRSMEAAEAYNRSAQLHPTRAKTWLRSAINFKGAGRYAQAADQGWQSLRANKSWYKPYIFLHSLHDAMPDREDIKNILQQGKDAGALNHQLQYPTHLFPHLTAKPVWDSNQFPVANQLELNYSRIRDDLQMNAHTLSTSILESENLTLAGIWKELFLFRKGIRNTTNCLYFPTICKIVAASPEVASMVLGDVKLSVIEAGTHIKAHTGPTNMKIRLHMGILIPPGGAGMRVGTAQLAWQQGKCLAFDDSFEHEVIHRGTSRRVVLIVDIWHPELSDKQQLDVLQSSKYIGPVKTPNSLARYLSIKRRFQKAK